jgi:hypothetical protein
MRCATAVLSMVCIFRNSATLSPFLCQLNARAEWFGWRDNAAFLPKCRDARRCLYDCGSGAAAPAAPGLGGPSPTANLVSTLQEARPWAPFGENHRDARAALTPLHASMQSIFSLDQKSDRLGSCPRVNRKPARCHPQWRHYWRKHQYGRLYLAVLRRRLIAEIARS